jgi:hypothetical protein
VDSRPMKRRKMRKTSMMKRKTKRKAEGRKSRVLSVGCCRGTEAMREKSSRRRSSSTPN